MGAYQKMKQAERVVELMTTNYENHKDDPQLSEMSIHRLKSAEKKYYTEKFVYTATITLMVFTILSMIGVGLVYLKNQGVFN
jgi:hypothetical protein